jgi:hypothetical protein
LKSVRGGCICRRLPASSGSRPSAQPAQPGLDLSKSNISRGSHWVRIFNSAQWRAAGRKLSGKTGNRFGFVAQNAFKRQSLVSQKTLSLRLFRPFFANRP